MIRILLKLAITMLCYLQIHCSLQTLHMTQLQTNSLNTLVHGNNFISESLKIDSSIYCGHLCAMTEACVALSYSETAGLCHLYSSYFVTDDGGTDTAYLKVRGENQRE